MFWGEMDNKNVSLVWNCIQNPKISNNVRQNFNTIWREESWSLVYALLHEESQQYRVDTLKKSKNILIALYFHILSTLKHTEYVSWNIQKHTTKTPFRKFLEGCTFLQKCYNLIPYEVKAFSKPS